MEDIFSLDHQTVVITGASGAVGSACARLFARVARAKVALIARRNTEELAANINSDEGVARSYQADISNRDQVSEAFQQISNDLGPIHSLLNIAGTCDFYQNTSTPLDKTKIDEERWDKIINVNGKGPALAIELAVPSMTKGSTIVNVGSTAGRYGAEFAVIDYSYSKAGLMGLTMGYAKILGPLGIRINTVAPGPIEETDMLAEAGDDAISNMKSQTKLGRICKPEDIAKVILFLASDMSGVITGTTVDANCGQYISY